MDTSTSVEKTSEEGTNVGILGIRKRLMNSYTFEDIMERLVYTKKGRVVEKMTLIYSFINLWNNLCEKEMQKQNPQKYSYNYAYAIPIPYSKDTMIEYMNKHYGECINGNWNNVTYV